MRLYLIAAAQFGLPDMPKRAIWNAAIGLAGCIYIVMVFILNVQSSIFALAFVLAAGYEVFGSRSARHTADREAMPRRAKPDCGS